MEKISQLLQIQDGKIGLLRSNLEAARVYLKSLTSNNSLVAGCVIQQSTQETRSVVAEAEGDPSPLEKSEKEKLKGLLSQLKKKSSECELLKAGKRYLTKQMTRLEKRIVFLEDTIRNQFKDVQASDVENMPSKTPIRPQQASDNHDEEAELHAQETPEDDKLETCQPSETFTEAKEVEITEQMKDKMKGTPKAVVGAVNPVHQRTDVAVDPVKAWNVDLRQKNAQLRADCIGLSEAVKNLNIENDSFRAENEELDEENESLFNENERLREKYEALSKEKERLTQRNNDLVRENNALNEEKEMQIRENRDLSEKNKILAEEKSNLVARNEKLQVENYALTNDQKCPLTAKEVLAAEKEAVDQQLTESTRAQEKKKIEEQF